MSLRCLIIINKEIINHIDLLYKRTKVTIVYIIFSIIYYFNNISMGT